MISREERDSIIKNAKDHKGITVELAMNCNQLETERDRLRKELEEWKSASLAWEREYHKDTEALREKADAATARAERAETMSVFGPNVRVVFNEGVQVDRDGNKVILSIMKPWMELIDKAHDARMRAVELERKITEVTASAERRIAQLVGLLVEVMQYAGNLDACDPTGGPVLRSRITAALESGVSQTPLDISKDTITEQRTELDSVIKERDHDNQVAIKKAILDRPDCAKKVQEMHDKIEQGKALLRECILWIDGEAARTPYIVTRIEEYLK